MTNFSPKIEIINHFDNLVNKLDIEIELCLEKRNHKEVLGQILESSSVADRDKFRGEKCFFSVGLFSKIESLENNIWTESTKVIDYLNQVRTRTIEELRKAQEDSLEYYKLNSSKFKCQLNAIKSIDELKSELFREQFYFQVNFTQPTKPLWCLDLFTFVTDFYMSQSDIDSLQKLINDEKEPFCRTPPPVFDQKMVLIGLLYKSFIENLSSRFPSQVISVRKYDVLNIEFIHFQYEYSGVELSSTTIDLSRLVNLILIERPHMSVRRESAEINIEGLSSLKTLHIAINSLEIYFSIRNLSSLKYFELIIPRIDENNTSRIFNQLQNIEELKLSGNLHNFNLDSFVNLRCLSLCDNINDGFNFELLKNLSNQLDKLTLLLPKFDYETILKILNGYNFSNLQSLVIGYSNIRRVEKKFIERFPSLKILRLIKCNIETIEDDAFSHLKDLILLDLSDNLLKSIYNRQYSGLLALEKIILSKNRIEDIEDGIFSHMNNLKDIHITNYTILKK